MICPVHSSRGGWDAADGATAWPADAEASGRSTIIAIFKALPVGLLAARSEGRFRGQRHLARNSPDQRHLFLP